VVVAKIRLRRKNNPRSNRKSNRKNNHKKNPQRKQKVKACLPLYRPAAKSFAA